MAAVRFAASTASASVLALVLLATDAAGQATVVGTIADSLTPNHPMEGFRVSLLGADTIRTVSSAGRFAFSNVRPGAYTISVRHPRLDSLGLPPLQASVIAPLADTIAVNLATISARDFQRHLCGADDTADTRLVLGEVLLPSGASVEGALVAAVWREQLVTRSGLETVLRGTVDTASGLGTFVLCGLPAAADVELRASRDALRSGQISIPASTEVATRFDLVVSDGQDGRSAIRGRIVDPDGQPLRASIILRGEPQAPVQTDSLGAFTLPALPRRSVELVARAIGYQPSSIRLAPTVEAIDLAELTLSPLPQELAERRISERAISFEHARFEERRRSAVGTFLDSTLLAKFPRVTANAIAANSRHARARGNVLNIRRGVGECSPRIFVDGAYVGRQGTAGRLPGAVHGEFFDQLLREAKLIEIYEAAFAPAEFADFDGCGALVIWTR